jgi:hypothetical protein
MNNSYERYTRKIDIKNDIYWKRLKNIDNCISINYCYFEQIKLFYSELEFLIICAKEINLSNAVLIYYGSVNNHINFLQQLFPELYWLLYTSDSFTVNNNIDIVGLDNTILDLLNHSFILQSKYILFINNFKSDDIMNNQQQMVIKLNADISLLRFNDFNKIDLSDINLFTKKPIGRPCSIVDNKFYYMAGDIYTYIHSKQSLIETMLIVYKRKNKYKMYNYDIKKYKEKYNYFNQKIRLFNMVYKDSDKLKEHIIGFQDNYETCSQYYIVESYFNLKRQPSTFNSICNLIYNIYHFYDKIQVNINGKLYNKSLAMCPLYSLYNEPHVSIDNIHMLYTILQDYNNNQIEMLKNKKILSKHDYNNQIYIINNGKKINNILNELII